jgi:hypothetical protein
MYHVHVNTAGLHASAAMGLSVLDAYSTQQKFERRFIFSRSSDRDDAASSTIQETRTKPCLNATA